MADNDIVLIVCDMEKSIVPEYYTQDIFRITV